jgi:Tol biopolymer transport system component/predicted Ser/Thr protein kinase
MSPQESIAHYRIVSKLGEGGMGEVYRATDTKLNRDVAIKILPEAFASDPERMARFTREAQVLASLNHPNIAAIYGVEERALIMELVEGDTLPTGLPLDTALNYARQIAEALEYAHEKGIVHRDLKPTNIKVTPEGRVKVLDFGLAKAMSSEPASGNPASSPTLTMRSTEIGTLLGTAAYMAPEQARGQNVDKRADIWAFGVVLYEMLTGRQLFRGETISDTLAGVLKTDPDWSVLPADTPAAIRRLLRRCLERDRKRRLPDIADARIEIDEALAPPAEPAPTIEMVSARGVGWPAFALVSILALAGFAVAVMHFREAPPLPPVARFQVPPPAGGSFSLPWIALSPDGRWLAFMASSKGGRPLIWLRALDSIEARALPGTENALFPFWSPDSHFLAFESDGKLKKVEVWSSMASALPQSLCDTSTFLGGDWNGDGVIYFGSPSHGIVRVPQAGGDAVAVTKTDSAQGELGHGYPQILPDGRHFLYLAVSRAGHTGAIYLSSLDGKEKKRLLATSYSFRYAPPAESGRSGHLLFVRDGMLMAQPLDPTNFDLSGDAAPVANAVATPRSNALFTISASGLAYHSAWNGGGALQMVWFDRNGKPQGILGTHASYGDVEFSPDGARAAITITDETTSRDVWLADMAHNVLTRFTFGGKQISNPVWSPDGGHMAYSARVSDGPSELYLTDSANSQKEERLQRSEVDERPCSWSPDGRSLMFARGRGLGSAVATTLWILSNPLGDPANRKASPYLETPFRTSECQFSPDSHWVAYTSNESGNRHEVYVQSFPVGAGEVRVSSEGGVQPRWRRDGKELFYVAADGKLMAVDVKTAPKFKHGTARSLFDTQVYSGPAGGSSAFHYDVSPDGQRFLVNTTLQGESPAASEAITVVLNWQSGLKK